MQLMNFTKRFHAEGHEIYRQNNAPAGCSRTSINWNNQQFWLHTWITYLIIQQFTPTQAFLLKIHWKRVLQQDVTAMPGADSPSQNDWQEAR